ncbi:hypothetical protein CYMTET_17149 [Cymbomonas tetramitiformis]|uniref:Nucleotide-diphospho-sugar transferase domain-containing protein n=1 Tax=Cymbomonas tetramitiformis TaxID=36881 RepID=A0AAE0GB03_9CHLO|nr:hypothetical protein CYMTET_17149 [Cymbomonas tetramitiformis]
MLKRGRSNSYRNVFLGLGTIIFSILLLITFVNISIHTKHFHKGKPPALLNASPQQTHSTTVPLSPETSPTSLKPLPLGKQGHKSRDAPSAVGGAQVPWNGTSERVRAPSAPSPSGHKWFWEDTEEKARQLPLDITAQLQPLNLPLSSSIKQRARVCKETLVVGFTNSLGVSSLSLMWARHLFRLGLADCTLLGITDPDLSHTKASGTLRTVMAMGLHVFAADSPETRKNKYARWVHVEPLAHSGLNLLLTDVDIAWLRNPLPYMRALVKAHPTVDFLISSDHEIATSLQLGEKSRIILESDVTSGGAAGEGELGMENPQSAHSSFNVGIMYLRGDRGAARHIIAEICTVLRASNWEGIDQELINLMLREGVFGEGGTLAQSSRGAAWDPALFFAANRSAMMGLLPTPQFCSGFTYSVTAEWRRIGVKPFALHTTYVQGQDLEAKLLRLLEEGLDDQDERYWQEGRYLVYNATVPEELLAVPKEVPLGAVPEHHLGLARHQLENLRNAIALARVLGRILVMPEFWCTCEGGLGAPSRNCVDTYHVLHLPYRCPADHLLSAKTWMRSSFPVTFREASFLENPLLAPEIRSSHAHVSLCNAEGNCAEEAYEAHMSAYPTATLRAGSTDHQVLQALGHLHDVRILHFDTMVNAFGGFVDFAAAVQLNTDLTGAATYWCCSIADDESIVNHPYEIPLIKLLQ